MAAKATRSKKSASIYHSPSQPDVQYQFLHAATENNLSAVSKKFGLNIHKRNKNGNTVLRCRQFRAGRRPTDILCQYRALFVRNKRAIYAIAGRTHDHKMVTNRKAKAPTKSGHIQLRSGLIKRQKPELTTANGEEEEGTSSSSNIGSKRRQGKQEQQPESESEDEDDEDNEKDDDEDGAALEEDIDSDDEEEEEEVQEQLEEDNEEEPNDNPPKKILCRTAGREPPVLYNFHRMATAEEVPAICKDLGLREYNFYKDGDITLRCSRCPCSHAGTFVAKYKAIYVTEEEHWTTDEEDGMDEDEAGNEEERWMKREKSKMSRCGKKQ